MPKSPTRLEIELAKLRILKIMIKLKKDGFNIKKLRKEMKKYEEETEQKG